MENLLTICMVTFNDADFIINNLYCLERITKNSYRVIIRDNDSNLKQYSKLERVCRTYPNVELYRIENFHHRTSMAHGIAINDLISRINTKYGVVLDADCTFLYKNWDEILINELNNECPIIGTQAALGYGGKKPGDFPLMYGILFDTDILKNMQIDFKPIDPTVFKDTGHELREKYLANGYKGKVIIGRNTRKFKSGPFHKIICTEYYLDGLKDIFVCHFGRGASLGKAKYLKIKRKDESIGHIKLAYIIPVLGKYLLKQKGKRQKTKWIKICKKIVDTPN